MEKPRVGIGSPRPPANPAWPTQGFEAATVRQRECWELPATPAGSRFVPKEFGAKPVAWLKLIGLVILLDRGSLVSRPAIRNRNAMSTREQLRTTLLNLLEEEMGESYSTLTDD